MTRSAKADEPTRDYQVELRDPVHGPVVVRGAELAVIDTPLFQRLRNVKQLGFAEFVFPGAVHNRYLHSIGAMHLGGLVFDAIASRAPWLPAETKARFRQMVRLAGLLHDAGHAPLSHAAESLMPRREDLALEGYGLQPGPASHEEVTLKLVVDSPLSRVLAERFGTQGVTPAHVAALLQEHDTPVAGDFVVDGVDHRPLLHAIISGELDVDRMDYLLRDSFFAGVGYGRYDLDWLKSNVWPVVAHGRCHLGIDLRALPTFEHFLLARYHMFQMVYFHPKSDIYDAMLRRWLETVGDEARFPAAPEDFVACDDPWLMARLRDSGDEWARRVRERDPYKLVLELREAQAHEQALEAEARLAGAGIDSLRLTAKPVLSRYARRPEELRTNPLYVRRGERPGRAQRIEEVTDLFDRYEQTVRVERVYVSREDRAQARALLDDLI